jgi:microcompartment protein CcmL/EutN
MDTSYGFIETRGFTAAIEAADAMVKAANVQLIRFRRVGSALVTVMVEGPLDSCQAAVQAGKAAAERIGGLISANVIPRPYDDLGMFVGKDRTEKPTVPPAKVKKPDRPKAVISALPDEDKIMELLSAGKEGLKAEDIAGTLNMASRVVRILLKSLMDSGKVEKIQQKYFLIKKGGRS